MVRTSDSQSENRVSTTLAIIIWRLRLKARTHGKPAEEAPAAEETPAE